MNPSPINELERKANTEIARLERVVAILEEIAVLAQRPELPVGVQRRFLNLIGDTVAPYRLRIRRAQKMRASAPLARTPWYRDGDQL